MISEEKLKIWRALSNLFLDTEVDEVIFKYIARTISESQFSSAEIEEILWDEVYPVLEGNLRSVAGVWDGWSDKWLLEQLPAPVRPSAIHRDLTIVQEIKQCWLQIIEIYESKLG